ncbi:MAG: glycosyltransferase family 2 protein [Clostridiales bacterium]|jgi:glycosyltransferase involved in cell wall biosynthesis|nr:glycosyltransferase family 2 protein [Clostridiales bacterium]
MADGVFFSLLVTVFNKESYIDDFFRSVLNQTYADFEVIVIDDGSSDGSGKIADSYAEKDRRIKVWHTSNRGVLNARKTALDKAAGEYILNVDSDDLLEPCLFETLAEAIAKHDCDLVLFDFVSFYADGRERRETYFDGERIFEGDSKGELFSELLTARLNSLSTKCYSKKIASISLDYGKFRGLKHGEDLLQSAYIISNAEKTLYLNIPLYRYRAGVGASEMFDSDSLKKYSIVADTIYSLIDAQGFITNQRKDEFFRLCRRQLNNHIGVMAKNSVGMGSASKLLKEAEGLTIYKSAASTSCNRFFSKAQNIKFYLVRTKRYRTAYAVQAMRQKLLCHK